MMMMMMIMMMKNDTSITILYEATGTAELS